MSTNHATLPNPLRSNEGCRNVYLKPRFTLFVDVEVRTTALTLHKIPNDHQLIHEYYFANVMKKFNASIFFTVTYTGTYF